MGRGRAKAKQTKVARQLKYSGGATDLDRLRSELGVTDSRRNGAEDDLDERYATWADQDDDEEEEDEDEDEEDDGPYGHHGSNGNNGSSRHRAG